MSAKHYGILIAAALVEACQPTGAPPAVIAKSPATVSSRQTATISGLSVKLEEDGRLLVDFDYFLERALPVMFRIELAPNAGVRQAGFDPAIPIPVPPSVGQHHFSRYLNYYAQGTTEQATLALFNLNDKSVVASQRIDVVIAWPTQDERDFSAAFELIENGSDGDLGKARETLERLVAKNPQLDEGYVELARIAMKTNWGPEGLHQAETLLDSALKIRSESANAKILLGYVYAQQHRFAEAEPLFVDAARTDPPNLWLWTNWGELFDMQGRTDEAIEKYRETIKRPLRSIRYQRARENAYILLIQSLEKRNDFDGAEALYMERVSELGESHCYKAAYARFKLNVRHDPVAAIDLARPALALSCEAPPRQLMGLANYLLWVERDGAESDAALNQARIFMPAGPMTLYLLASNDTTVPAAKKLVASGEAIDQKDNDEMTALAFALQKSDLNAAERLLTLGASPETPVTSAAIPVALLPVLESNRAGIDVLRRAGVDYSKLRYRGSTALDFAKQIGDDALLDALKPKGHTL